MPAVRFCAGEAPPRWRVTYPVRAKNWKRVRMNRVDAARGDLMPPRASRFRSVGSANAEGHYGTAIRIVVRIGRRVIDPRAIPVRPRTPPATTPPAYVAVPARAAATVPTSPTAMPMLGQSGRSARAEQESHTQSSEKNRTKFHCNLPPGTENRLVRESGHSSWRSLGNGVPFCCTPSRLHPITHNTARVRRQWSPNR